MSSAPPAPPDPPTPPTSPASGKTIAARLGAFFGMSVLGGVLIAGMLTSATAAISTVAEATEGMLAELPSTLDLPQLSQQSVIRYADGSHMATFYAENRIVVPLDKISQPMRDAVIAIEDKRFYSHAGVDPQGIARAFVNNLLGGPLEGASTLTQQYVRNSLVEAGRQSGDEEQIDAATETTLGRKLREMSLALTLEKEVEKDEILAGYLNIAQFGPSQYGVEAAARHYFSIPASELSVVQAATLAGITQSPNRWDPVDHPQDAKTRRDTVLMEMHSQGYISDEEYQQALDTSIEETLRVQNTPNGCAAAGNAAYFCEYVVKDLLNNDAWGESRDERTRLLYRGGLVIDTTLDPAKQQAAQQALEGTIPTADPSNIDASIVSLQPGTGHIVAMAQNTVYGVDSEGHPDTTQINVNVGKSHGGGLGFQSGSSFKTFTLVEWINSGRSVNASVSQSEKKFSRGSWKIPCAPELADTYSPKNLYRMSGTTTVARATKLSTNLPFVHMANQLDLCKIMDDAAKMGVERGDGSPLVPQPAAILGTNEVTPLSMANAFGTIAARGKACKPVAVTKISLLDGTEIATTEPQCEQVFSQAVMDSTTYALRQVMQPGGTGDKAALPGRPTAGKTGTANDAANGWMVGFTPQYATAVWTGHRGGNQPMLNVRVNGRYYGTVYGSTLSGPIWRSYMTDAHQGRPVEQLHTGTRGYGETTSRSQRSRGRTAQRDVERVNPVAPDDAAPSGAAPQAPAGTDTDTAGQALKEEEQG